MPVIYEPGGKAREYAPLALNLYTGCTHGCRYCYVPRVLFRGRDEFHTNVEPRKNILVQLERDAKRLAGDEREILLSFTSDPYQPAEAEFGVTRQAIKILREHDLRFTILSKGGLRAVQDFDLLRGYEKFRFGTTLITFEKRMANEWEPNAAAVVSRVVSLHRAKDAGFPTWVSLEPVIEPQAALTLIHRVHPLVDHWKIGKLNYFPDIERRYDWIKFREDARALLDSLGADYHFKRNLAELQIGEVPL